MLIIVNNLNTLDENFVLNTDFIATIEKEGTEYKRITLVIPKDTDGEKIIKICKIGLDDFKKIEFVITNLIKS